MKTPDSDPSIHDLPEAITGELIQNDDERQEADPLNVLLADNLSPDSDDERLYSDEFIRANENASRSLFLGFLGIALLGTSFFAWFILSQPNATEREIEEREQPISVPIAPSTPLPNGDLSAPPSNPSPPPVPTPNTPGTESPQSPLLFPVTPVNPNTSSPSTVPQSLPEGSVPPPPPSSTP